MVKCEVCGEPAAKGAPIRRARRVKLGECVGFAKNAKGEMVPVYLACEPTLYATPVRVHMACANSAGMLVHGSKAKGKSL